MFIFLVLSQTNMFTPIIGSDYSKKIIDLIDAATKNIDLVLYDWRWYQNQPGHPVQKVNNALVRAYLRGVQVRAVLNRTDLLPTLNSVGIKARCLKDKRTLHCKLVIFDSSVLVIGSHNLTRNAMSHNVEASIAVDIPQEVTRFTEFFNNLYGL